MRGATHLELSKVRMGAPLATRRRPGGAMHLSTSVTAGSGAAQLGWGGRPQNGWSSAILPVTPTW
jgi:hypothetical protein